VFECQNGARPRAGGWPSGSPGVPASRHLVKRKREMAGRAWSGRCPVELESRRSRRMTRRPRTGFHSKPCGVGSGEGQSVRCAADRLSRRVRGPGSGPFGPENAGRSRWPTRTSRKKKSAASGLPKLWSSIRPSPYYGAPDVFPVEPPVTVAVNASCPDRTAAWIWRIFRSPGVRLG